MNFWDRWRTFFDYFNESPFFSKQKVQKLVKEADIFGNLGLHDETKIIDNATVKNPWLLYGSRKSEDMDPYRITKVYDKDMKEISVKDAFDDYVVYDKNEDKSLVVVIIKFWKKNEKLDFNILKCNLFGNE